MIISTFSYLWSSSAIDIIPELARSGHRVFEVPISSPHCWPDEMAPSVRAEGRRRLQDCGAWVRSLNAGGYDINLASPAANMRRKSIDHIRDVIELGVAWGSTDIVISPGTRRPMISPPLSHALDWLYESLDVLLPLAEQAGIRLLLENTPYCFRPTIGELIDVVRQVDRDALKIVYDVANAAYIGENPVAAMIEGRAEIALAHISDTGLDLWGHDPIGTGVIDFDTLGAAIHETCGIENSVLEIIRENSPFKAIGDGIADLASRGWQIPA